MTALAPLPSAPHRSDYYDPVVGPDAPDATRDASVFHEAMPFATLPIALLGDRRLLTGAPVAKCDETAAIARVPAPSGPDGWQFRHPRGVVHSPTMPADGSPGLQAELVLDVYAGLLLSLAEAGFPADGRVQVGRHELLHRIKWVGPKGSAGGRLYNQLDAVVRYLADVSITSPHIQQFVSATSGEPMTGQLTFRILQAHGRVTEMHARGMQVDARPGAGHAADDLVVFFSTPFVQALRCSDQRVTYRMEHYLRFAAGAPRALYRYVTYLASQQLTNGQIVVDLDEVFASVGSAQRGSPAAKARQLFGGAEQLLVDLGLLRCLPDYRSSGHGARLRRQAVFSPLPPPTTELRALLRSTLIAYGVRSTVAARYTDSNTEAVAEVVAAVTLGMLEVRRDLPSMVIDYCKHPGRFVDVDRLPRFRPTLPSHRRTDITGNAAMEYLEQSADANETYLRGLSADDRAARRAAYEGQGRLGWVVDGLVLAGARLDRHGASLDTFLRARGARR